ncbi:hypothetical protein D3C76_1429350 [compost metagenome]
MVNRNQVDVAQHRLKDTGQFLGVFRLVINPADQSVFEADPAACLGLIVTQGFNYVIKRVTTVNRHQLGTQRIIRCMDRNRQIDLGVFVGEFVNVRHNAAGGDSDVALSDIQPFFMDHQPQESHGGIVVLERLTCTHDNDTADTFITLI